MEPLLEQPKITVVKKYLRSIRLTHLQYNITKTVVILILFIFIIMYQTINLFSVGFSSNDHAIKINYLYQFNKVTEVKQSFFETNYDNIKDSIYRQSLTNQKYAQDIIKNQPISIVINGTNQKISNIIIQNSSDDFNYFIIQKLSARKRIMLKQPYFNKQYWNYFVAANQSYQCGNIHIDQLQITPSSLHHTNIPIWYLDYNKIANKFSFQLSMQFQENQCFDFLLIRDFAQKFITFSNTQFNGRFIVDNVNSSEDFQIFANSSQINKFQLAYVPWNLIFIIENSKIIFELPLLSVDDFYQLYGVLTDSRSDNINTYTKVNIIQPIAYHNHVNIYVQDIGSFKWQKKGNTYQLIQDKTVQVEIILNNWACRVIEDPTYYLRCFSK